MREARRCSFVAAIAVLVAGFALAAGPSGAAVQAVYDNALRNGWQDWGWATRNPIFADGFETGSTSAWTP